MFHELAAVLFRLLTQLVHSVPLIMSRQQAEPSWSWQKGAKKAKGGKKRKEKKALKKTELAKLYFKVG